MEEELELEELGEPEEVVSVRVVKPNLFLVCRRDMSLGQQLVQSSHVAIDFILQYPEIAKEWRTTSNHIAALSVKDEAALQKLVTKAIEQNIKHVIFKEPDANYSLTAIAFEPSEAAKKLCKKIMPTFWEGKLP